VYAANCVGCHGIQGRGDGPDAAKLIVSPANFQRPTSRAKSEMDLRSAIIWGLAFSPMHGWWDKLSVEEIRAVTAYIRRLAPYEPSSP
jgi:mono/diheme cytochrome c family protein